MIISDSIAAAVTAAKARVCLGYPWWLRPWLARDVIAITLGRRIYLSPAMGERPAEALERLLRHELTHVRQVNRLSLPVFLVLYGAEFVRHFLRVRSVSKAYRMISFEAEAWAAETEETANGPIIPGQSE